MTIITIIIHVTKANNKEFQLQKIDWHKWPTNGCIIQSIAILGQKMADGQPDILYSDTTVIVQVSTSAHSNTIASHCHNVHVK